MPYRPYVYRPSFGIGVYYGAGGSYPYGYTPRGYYDPLPGHVYGGLRITGAPREAQVFADGYYVGIVNDFDGVFQHVNLEAGEHHIEIESPGFEPVAFDVLVSPAARLRSGQTWIGTDGCWFQGFQGVLGSPGFTGVHGVHGSAF